MASQDPLREGADKVLGAAIDSVPEGSPLKQALIQAGWVGLVLGVLIGNVPVSAVVAAAVKGNATLDAGALETYFTVFVLVTPWVAVATLFSYWTFSDNTPQMSGYALCFLIAILVAAAGAISLSLGGVVPAEVAAGPTAGGPSGSAQYAVNGLGSYIDLYGPWPPLAGAIEGTLFGYWISALTKPETSVT